MGDRRQHGDGKRKSLFQELRIKMGIEDDHTLTATPTEDDEDIVTSPRKWKKLVGNQNAATKYRTIILGWIHNGKNVRDKTGGGARKIKVKNSATKKDISAEGYKLFGAAISRRGNVNTTTFNVLDYCQVVMPLLVTVGQVYDIVKPSSYLKFYFSSTTLHGKTATSAETVTSAPAETVTSAPGETVTSASGDTSSTSTASDIPELIVTKSNISDTSHTIITVAEEEESPEVVSTSEINDGITENKINLPIVLNESGEITFTYPLELSVEDELQSWLDNQSVNNVDDD